MPNKILSTTHQPLYDLLEKNLQRLQSWHIPLIGTPAASSSLSSFNQRRAAAATLHSVILYDHPDLLAWQSQGFTDGIVVYVAAPHVQALMHDDIGNLKGHTLYHWLSMAFDDIVAQHAFPDLPSLSVARCTRADVVHRFQGIDINSGMPIDETLSMALDEQSQPMLAHLYGNAHLDTCLLDDNLSIPKTQHAYADFHPMNRWSDLVQGSRLAAPTVQAWLDFIQGHGGLGGALPPVPQALQALTRTFGCDLFANHPRLAAPAMQRFADTFSWLSENQGKQVQAARHDLLWLLLPPEYSSGLKDFAIENLCPMPHVPVVQDVERRDVVHILHDGLALSPLSRPFKKPASSLSGSTMGFAVQASQGRDVGPTVKKVLDTLSSSQRHAWCEDYLFALPWVWVNHLDQQRGSSRENAWRWHQAVEPLTSDQIKIALRGVKLLSAAQEQDWYELWVAHTGR